MKEPTAGGRSLSPDEQARLRQRLRPERATAPASAIVRRPEGRGPIPVSLAQQQLWLLDRMAEGGEYVIAMSLGIAGPLQVAALERAVAAIVERHEILRTTFLGHTTGVSQVVGDSTHPSLPCDDLSGSGRDGDQARAIRASEAARAFDLQTGPLFRARLLRFGASEHELLLSCHHIVADGWSLALFVHELVAFYDALVNGTTPRLAELIVQYGDYAIWQGRVLEDPAFARQRNFWKTYLAGSEPTSVPADRARNRTSKRTGARARATVSAANAQALRTVARQSNATLYMALLAAFDIVLFRLTGQDDIVIGTPMANRSRPELEPLIGCFVNSVVVRTRINATASFRQTLAGVREAALAAFEHQSVPFPRIVEDVAPARDVGTNPIFHIGFNILDGNARPLAAGGVEFGPLQATAERTRFDIEVHASETGGGVDLNVLYRTDLYDADTIERLLGQYVRVLEQVVANPDITVDAIALLTRQERQALLTSGRGHAGGYPRNATLHELLDRQIPLRGSTVAVEDGLRSYTYAELGSAARRVARMLRNGGAVPNSAVGVWLERDARLAVSLAGIAMAGAAYVPAEVHQPPARAAAMWNENDVAMVVTTSDLAAGVPAGPWRVVTLESTESTSDDPIAPLGAPDDIAYVLYTSGSTGRPKGVAVPQRAVVRLVCETDYVDLSAKTVMAQAASVAFDAATFEFWGALLNGGRLVVIPTRTVVDPAALGEALRRSNVTTTFLTTALMHQIGREAPGALAGVHTVLFGGEAVTPRWIAAILNAGGPEHLVHVYGPTENTTFSTWFPVRAVAADAETIPIGASIAQSETYVLDRSGSPVPVGTEGELFLGGDGLARGYVAAPRQTAELFVPDAVSGQSGARLYRTGDVVRWKQPGAIEFVGRRDGQIKLRGHRIELGEIEAALGQIAGVGTSVVLVAGAAPDQHLVAYVTPSPAHTLDGRSVRDSLKGKLPTYMIPAAVHVLARLPLNANGKIDRPALIALDRRRESTVTTAPATRIEQQIIAIWREVLATDDVGPDDNFFDLGGHSLLLVRVQSALKEALGRPVALVTLFEHPTVSALAAHLAGATRTASPAAHATTEPIAVIGLAGRFPGAPDTQTFWEHLRAGHELIRRFTPDELQAAGVPDELVADPQFVPARGALDGIDLFDAGLFGYAPREAALIDPQQRILLETAWTALEQAGYAPGLERAGAIGVYVGTSANSYIGSVEHDALSGIAPLQVLLASDKDFLASRVSYKLRLTGPAITVQTACSTSLVAVHEACQAIRAGECAMALAGGVSVTVPAIGGYRYHEEGIASPDGHCRAFDARAAGTVPGNGAGIVVLKSFARAVHDGDHIHAVIRGSAINNDGSDKVGFTAPSVRGQAAVIAAALKAAGVPADSIGCVEAHGTGTALGDPIEVAALRQAFGDGLDPASCALGSVKTNVGHLDAAAGITGLIKTVLALEHGELPASLHFANAGDHVDLGPFFIPTTTRPWTLRPDVPRRAGVSSFGMGGTNAHVVIEEAPPLPPSAPNVRRWHVVPVAGQSIKAAAAACEAIASYIEQHGDVSLDDVVFTQQVGRAALPVRRVAVGVDRASIVAALRLEAQSGKPAPARRALIWTFPGQGSQFVDMGRDLYESEPVFAAEIDACAAAVKGELECDLRQVVYPRPGGETEASARLGQTVWAQVSLVAVELALAALWKSWGIVPDAVLGHSVGEIAAACVAGVFSRDDAMRLAAVRGRLMGAAPSGGMIAVAAPEGSLADEIGPGIWLAAVNGPMQCVVAGTDEALAAFADRMRARGIVTRRLASAGAFHSGLMEAVTQPLTAAAAGIDRSSPRVPWISSTKATLLSGEDAMAAEYWGRQVVMPVRWADAAGRVRHEMSRDPFWLEVGPGHTLTHLGAGSGADDRVASLEGPDAAESIARALGALFCTGIVPDWKGLHRPGERHVVSLPTYPFQRQRYWLGSSRSPAGARSSASHVTKRPDLRDWCYVPSWARVASVGLGVQRGEHCVVIVDVAAAADFAAQLRAALESRGIRVTMAGPDREGNSSDAVAIDVNSPASYRALFEALRADDGPPTRVLHALGVGDRPASAESREMDRCFSSVVALTQALGADPSDARVPITVLTTGAVSVRGDEGVFAGRSALLGLCRVIPQEYPTLPVHVVDLDWVDSSWRGWADGVVADLLGAGDERTIAWRNERRWAERFEPIPKGMRDQAAVAEGGTYLITGGLGRIGLALARHWVSAARAKVVLLSRTELPPRSQWSRRIQSSSAGDRIAATLRALLDIESQGGAVYPVAADVSDAEALRAAIAQAEPAAGPIRGVVHAAGATTSDDFALIADLDPNACDRMLAAKVGGALALQQVFAGRSLDFRVLMSSLSSVLGGLGFAGYAAANAFLNGFAEAESRGSEPWLSIAWDGWQFEPAMNAARSAASRSESDAARLAIAPAEGVEAFSYVLSVCRSGTVVVSTGDLTMRRNRQLASPVGVDSIERAADRHARVAFAAPGAGTQTDIAAAWERALGVDRVALDDNFFELGGDSLMAIHLLAELQVGLGIKLTLKDLWQNATVRQLSERVDALRRTESEASAEVSRAMALIQEMSDADVDRLLSE